MFFILIFLFMLTEVQRGEDMHNTYCRLATFVPNHNGKIIS